MCKILTITGPLNKRATSLFLSKANKLMADQKDGFGFLATDGQHTAHGRYLQPASFDGWNNRLPGWLVGQQLETGRMPDKARFLLCHGRTSTNVHGISYCHPFRQGEQYLIHNGILDWQGAKKEEPPGKCDSEQLLAWLAKGGPMADLPKLWAGYGAIFWLNGKRLTLIKDSIASLYVAKRQKSLGWVFGTVANELEQVCKAAGVAIGRVIPVPKVIVTFKRNGDFGSYQTWDGFAARKFDKLSYLSLGGYRGLSTTPPRPILEKGDSIAIEPNTVTGKASQTAFPDWEPDYARD